MNASDLELANVEVLFHNLLNERIDWTDISTRRAGSHSLSLEVSVVMVHSPSRILTQSTQVFVLIGLALAESESIR